MAALNDPKHEAFARHIASGKTKREAAILAGFSAKTASSQGSQLAKRVKIAKRIEELQGRLADKVIDRAVQLIDLEIASRVRRVEILDDYSRRLQKVFDARAADPTMKGVAGAETGLIVRTIKAVNSPKGMQIVQEFAVDTSALRELRAFSQQAAVEAGQWNNAPEDTLPTTKIEVGWVKRKEQPSSEESNTIPGRASSDSTTHGVGSKRSQVQ